MNQAQVEGLARIWLTALAATIGLLGWLHGVDFVPLVALGVGLIGSVWSIHANKTSTMTDTVAKSDTVDHVQMKTDALANATDALKANDKVVGPPNSGRL